jgi:hypothetical protein
LTSMGMTAPRARAATRALAVLAILLGLLAMHGLASTHHAAAASTPAHTAQADAAPAGEVVGAHDHAFAMSAAEHDTTALAPDPGATCDQTCPDLAVLCVAVLTGAALALLLARHRSSPQLLAPATPRPAAPAPPVRHARGPDPVRELCVSRT